MSVVMVHPEGGKGGPARTLLSLASYLASRVDLTIAAPNGFVINHLQEASIEAVVFPFPLRRSRASSWIRGSGALTAAFAGKGRSLVFHANGLSALNLIGPAAKRTGAPVFVHFHSHQLPARSRAHLTVWRRLGVRMALFPVSDFSRRIIDRTDAGVLVRGVLPNPVDLKAFAAQRKEPRSPFRIGFLGSKSPTKGLHRVVETAGRLRDENVEWHVYGITADVSGNAYVDSCRSRIAELALGDRFRWLGKVREMPPAYASIDALFVPSSMESFSRVALEGMASGLPVVASRVGGLAEVVGDGRAGLLFNPADLDEAACHLRTIVHDHEARRRLTAGAIKRAARFDLPVVGRLLESFYEELLEDSPRLTGTARGT